MRLAGRLSADRPRGGLRCHPGSQAGTMAREMTAEWLLGWWNAIYVLPFGLALAYLFAYALSGWTFGDADAPHGDLHGQPHVDVHDDVGGHELPHHPPIHTPATDLDADSDVGGAKSTLLQGVSWLGVGRVPLSILLMVLFLSFGAIGFVTNQLFMDLLSDGLVAVASLPAAVIGSLAITAAVGNSIARWLPMTESSARPRRELVGLRATAVFAIDDLHGMAMVRDSGGDRYQVACRVLPDREAIPGGTEVVLVKYAAEPGVFYVVPSDLVEGSRELSGEAIGDVA